MALPRKVDIPFSPSDIMLQNYEEATRTGVPYEFDSVDFISVSAREIYDNVMSGRWKMISPDGLERLKRRVEQETDS